MGEMRRRASIVPAVILLGMTALAVSGCGSKSKATAPKPSAAPGAKPAPKAPTATSIASAARLAQLTSTENCDQLYNMAKSFSAALNGDGQDLDKTVVVLKKFANQSPSEIRPDFQVLATVYTKIVSALKGSDAGASSSPSKDTIARLTKLSGQVDMARVSVANTKITAWAAKNCRNYAIDVPVQP
jgi:hypothetical protein